MTNTTQADNVVREETDRRRIHGSDTEKKLDSKEKIKKEKKTEERKEIYISEEHKRTKKETE